jgi:hypothetical protein
MGTAKHGSDGFEFGVVDQKKAIGLTGSRKY